MRETHYVPDLHSQPLCGASLLDAPATTRWDSVACPACRDLQHTQGLAALAKQRDDLDRQISEYVTRAHEAGKSWREIGECLGVTKQAAQQRYGNRPAAPKEDPAQAAFWTRTSL